MKRFTAILLILCLAAGLFACAKGGKKEDAPETKANRTEPENTLEKKIAEEEKAILDMSLTEETESWRGQGETGFVTLPGDWNATVLRSPETLAPYRGYFPELSDADAARIVADADGIAVLLEVASPDTSLIYGVNDINLEGDQIVFMVSAVPYERVDEPSEDGEMEPDPGSPHEFFLFYISAEHYHDEPLQFVFVT